MQVLHAHCAGLDVHKGSVVACVRHMVQGKVTSAIKTFMTTTQELMALSEWLSMEGVTHVAMEATGVYWKPVWHILSDGEFALVLANAAHVKNVPGRKTDVNDAAWLADLMAHGLIRPVLCPTSRPSRCATCCALASSSCASAAVIRSASRRRWRMPTSSSIRSSAISWLPLRRRMIEALIAGQTDPEASGGTGSRAHPRHQSGTGGFAARPSDGPSSLPAAATLDHLDALNAPIAGIDKEVDGKIEPFRAAIEMLSTIPGLSDLSAAVLMSRRLASI